MKDSGCSSIRLRVETLGFQDTGRGIARISQGLMDLLSLDVGDVAGITGMRTTCVRVLLSSLENKMDHIVQIDETTMANAGIAAGDEIELSAAEARRASAVVIAEDKRTIGFAKKAGSEYIKKMLKSHCICKGDFIAIPHLGSAKFSFHVIGTFPEGFVTIDDSTKFVYRDEQYGASGEAFIGYKDIGGLDTQISKIKEIVEYPMVYSDMFKKLNLRPSKGILLYGPPGTGKTLIAKAIANEVNAKFITINGPEIINKYYGESEAKIREIFEDAKENSPSIIFIDEIDAIAPKREEVQGDVEKRIVAQLLSLMDGVRDRSSVIVIGATNLPNTLDPALRRPGRFDREFYIGVPDESARLEILKIHIRLMPLAEDVDISSIAARTHGYVGADLSSLCTEASMNCIRRYLAEHPYGDRRVLRSYENMKISQADFMLALNEVPPSAIREVMVEVPHVTWDMIGGLSSIKNRIRECIEWPLKYPRIFSAMKIRSPRGILLYGPPGTGKTLVARAIATESGANFISVKGPELLSKWQGESEKGIREVFRRAKQTAPCIIFFDEIDSLASISAHGNSGQMSVVAQLLTELDGIEGLENVIAVGATNRIEEIDKALLRDGRFDIILKFNLPNAVERKEIFSLHLKEKPLDPSVDMDELTALTEGFSGAEIGGACTRAAFLAIRDFLSTNDEEWSNTLAICISRQHLKTALTNRMEDF